MAKKLIQNGVPKYGVYTGVNIDPNLMDTTHVWNKKTPSFFKDFRLKEWQAFQLWTPEYFVFGAVYNAKVTGIVLLSVYHMNTGELYHYSKKTFPRKLKIGKQLTESISSFFGRKLSLKFKNNIDQFEIISKSKNTDLQIKGARISNSLSVCLPLGKNRSMYSHKCLIPVTGIFSINKEKIMLSPDNSQLIIDHHKGFYPYRLSYDWTTASWRKDGVLYGFNLTRNQVINPEKYNENCLWYGDQIIHLPAVKYTFFEKYWQIKSNCGKVDVRFYPKIDNPIKFNAIILAVNYSAPYGHFEGKINMENKSVTFNKVFGMGEIKRYRM